MKTLDTRDLYKRKCELEDLRDAIETAEEELTEALNALNAFDESDDSDPSEDERDELEEALTDAKESLHSAQEDFGDDEREELEELETIENEVSDFRHGETMIPEGDFREYAEELAGEIGAIDPSAGWPLNCIDWNQAADELRMDYTEIEYQGETYLVRA